MDNAHQFAQTHLMPRIIRDFRDESFDKEILKLMGGNGLLGCTLNEYGGAGLNDTSYGLINREI
jgi:glutaryl-CoA dehydrogenase